MTYEQLQEINSHLSTMNIKGKEYAQVNQRVLAFRKLYPEGCIKTELVSDEGGKCIFVARAYRSSDDTEPLATGFAYEKEDSSYINKTSYLENCETSSVGRCLGFLGIGIDTSIASAEEVTNAINNQPLQKKEYEILKNTWIGAGGTEENLLAFCKVKKADQITNAMRDKCMAKLKEKEDGK